jgi:hypothetical protein
MDKVIITTRSGRRLRVPAAIADVLARRGKAEVAPPAPALEDLTVAELRERAVGLDITGTGANGNIVKADLLAALRAPEKYKRRDMRAED